MRTRGCGPLRAGSTPADPTIKMRSGNMTDNRVAKIYGTTVDPDTLYRRGADIVQVIDGVIVSEYCSLEDIQVNFDMPEYN